MNKPKIGIRPVIDGRWGGVREALKTDPEHGKKLRQNSSKVTFIIRTALRQNA